MLSYIYSMKKSTCFNEKKLRRQKRKSTSDIVPEVKKMFQVIISISTYFHSSGIRTRELKAVAEETKCPLLHLPKLFEVRWSEFSYALLNAVLVSWKVLVEYMKSSSDSECRGFLKFLLTEDNLLLLSFLADCLFVFKRYKKIFKAMT